MMKIYLAGPLFTEAERDWMRKVKKELEDLDESQGRQVNVIWPYEIITQSEIDRLGEKARHEIFSRCKAHLDDADIVIALLDGPQVDDGTAWEVGYFYAKKSPKQKIIGIRTDFRRAGESEGTVVNAMIEFSCDRIVRSREELAGTILAEFAQDGQNKIY
jgi:nucleoside 2-deoxyribosyltransferase